MGYEDLSFQKPEPKYDAEGRLLIDCPCHKCGYNLRGHYRKGECSECGSKVEDAVAKLQYFSPTRKIEPPYELIAGTIVISKMWLLTAIAAVFYIAAVVLLVLQNKYSILGFIFFIPTMLFFIWGQLSAIPGNTQEQEQAKTAAREKSAQADPKTAESSPD